MIKIVREEQGGEIKIRISSIHLVVDLDFKEGRFGIKDSLDFSD